MSVTVLKNSFLHHLLMSPLAREMLVDKLFSTMSTSNWTKATAEPTRSIKLRVKKMTMGVKMRKRTVRRRFSSLGEELLGKIISFNIKKADLIKAIVRSQMFLQAKVAKVELKATRLRQNFGFTSFVAFWCKTGYQLIEGVG